MNGSRAMNGFRAMSAGVALLVVAAAGCATTGRGDLPTSAERLDHSAYALARTVTDETPSDHYVRDVQALSADAHALRRVTEERDASDADVRAAFSQVSRSYLQVRDDVARVDTAEARESLRPVTHDYLNVERDLGGYPASPEG